MPWPVDMQCDWVNTEVMLGSVVWKFKFLGICTELKNNFLKATATITTQTKKPKQSTNTRHFGEMAIEMLVCIILQFEIL